MDGRFHGRLPLARSSPETVASTRGRLVLLLLPPPVPQVLLPLLTIDEESAAVLEHGKAPYTQYRQIKPAHSFIWDAVEARIALHRNT